MSRRHLGAAALATALLAAPPAVLAVNPGSSTTSTGQPLNVRIDAPAAGSSVTPGDLDVTGVAAIGALAGAGKTNVVYVVDNSGSTTASAGDCNGDGTANAGDDINGDGSPGTILDCELSGITALNASLYGPIGAGMVAFGSMADLADMSPAAGQQDFTGVADDLNKNGRRDVAEVAASVNSAGFGQFTKTTTSGGLTDFNLAIGRVNGALASRAGARNTVFFLSDGQSTVNTEPGSPLAQAAAAGTRINTYSVGTAASGCASGSSLRTIADTTGGTCNEAADPTKLTATIGGAASTGLKDVVLRVNSGAPLPAVLSGLGTWGVKVPAAQLRNGTNTLAATVTAADGTTASADISVTVGAAGAFTPSSVLNLPSSRRCTSKRLFPIRIRQVKGVRYDFATVYVNGRRVRVYVRTTKRWVRVSKITAKLVNVKAFRAYVDLRGLAKGAYKVKIVVVANDGRVVSGWRTYRTCTKKLTGSVPKL